MALPPTVPKSALDKYTPAKFVSQSADGFIFASFRKVDVTPTLSSLLALKIPSLKQDREALLGQLESLRDVNSRRISKVIDYDPRGDWYITPFCHGQNLQYLKATLFRDGFPPFLVCKIFVKVMAAQDTLLGPEGICHADFMSSNIILSPAKEELPYVRIVHLEGIAIWNEQAIVRQMIGLLRYLTNGESRIPDYFRTNKKGDMLENSLDNSDVNSLANGDEFYSFISNYDLEGQKSWKSIKSEWTNMASSLMWELLERGRLADIKEAIKEQKVTNEELRQAVEDGGMDVIDDRDL